MTQYPRTVLGIDPGTANIGFALVRKDSARARPRVLRLGYLGTTKGDGAVIEDDVRRLRLFLREFLDWVPRSRDATVVVEWYAPRGRQRSGWKTALTVGAVFGAALVFGGEVVAAPPHARTAASKDKAKVVAAMRRRVRGFGAALAEFPARQHEHIADAAAHAVAVLEA